MASGLFSAKTVAHFCPGAATSSCGPAVAVCTERLNTSRTPLIQRRDCIIPSFMFERFIDEARTADVNSCDFLHCAPARRDSTYSFRNLREDDQWPGAPRPSLRSASASRSTGTCRLSSDPAELAPT